MAVLNCVSSRRVLSRILGLILWGKGREWREMDGRMDIGCDIDAHLNCMLMSGSCK